MPDKEKNSVILNQIEEIKEKCDKIKPLVAIRCITYNHGPYIKDALEGFVMQKTDFPFVAIVHDDASTDNTVEIIKEYAAKYPDIILPIFEKENQYSKRDGSLGRIMDKACEITGAKYIAWCEGDDYWIDPLKLQIQVDFLETHPDYGMCYTNFNIFKQESKKVIYDVFNTLPKRFKSTYNSPDEFVLSKGFVCPPSWLMRQSAWNPPKINSVDGTFVYFTHFLATSKVRYIPEITTTYRLLKESASHSSDKIKLLLREKKLYETQLILIDTYRLNPKIKSICEENYYKVTLKNVIAYHQNKDEIHTAKIKIKNPDLKTKFLFLISDLHLGRLLKIIDQIRVWL